MSITTVDNFDSSFCNDVNRINTNGFKFVLDENKKYSFVSTTGVNDIYITLKKYKENKNELFSLVEQANNKDDDLILSVSSYVDSNQNTIYTTETGNYIGKFKYGTIDINIKSRFSDIFLKRMLNFANDVFLDDVSAFNAKENKNNDLDYSKYIICYMFIQKLEKAFLLGLPKSYISVNHHEMKVKGKIDINRFIKYDIPFKGKVSSTSRDQKEIQEIIDVLYKAISIIEKNKFNTKNISHIKTPLKQHRSNRYVSNETISKAIKSKVLQNPIFAPYKKVLEYAKLIINANNLEEKKDANKETFGFLVNVAELFEIYLVKLLRLQMPGWEVTHDRENELTVYNSQFYKRHMYPDIVMKKDDQVMVFDAKYKRMIFTEGIGDGKRGDLDRSDFFQINTYMTYYNKKGYDVITGGLLYPIESKFNEDKAHSDNWFGDNKTKFIIDGIDLSYIEDKKRGALMDSIVNAENSFINRIKQISKNTK